MNIESIRAFVRATREKRELEARLREAQQRLDVLADVALKELAADGVPNATIDVDGERMTIYRHSIMVPQLRDGIERPAVAACLKQYAPDLVREDYNANSFAAWVRERLGDHELPLPADLSALVDVREVAQARAKEASRAASKSERAAATLRGDNASPAGE